MMTLAEVKTQSKTKVTMTIFLVLANITPAKTAIGIQAKMKNLYMSHGLGVKRMTLGIKNRRRKVPFKSSFPRFTKEIMAIMKGMPRFKK